MTPPRLRMAGTAAPSAALRAWCEADAFVPPVRLFAQASSAPDDALDDFACVLDGSAALARLSRLRGLAWRLGLLLRERRPGHRPHADDPWDCGWWRAGALDAAAAFRPRRPTLLLVPDAPGVDALVATLQAQSVAYARPLRVLRVSAAPLAGMPRL